MKSIISLIMLVGALSMSQTYGQDHQYPLAIDRGKIFEVDGHKYLWGGEKEAEHFDITACALEDSNFHFGIGRERFPALISPEFCSVKEANSEHKSDDRFLLVSYEGETKAYSVKDLTHHEVVNDSIGGRPIMAAYCVLADLGAIYERKLGSHTFTFALSGYTYHDPQVWEGLDGFVMWDRETESLWWPLIGKAVSGPLKDVSMQVMDEQYWSQTTWKEVKKNYPDAQVLISGQDFERPKEWPKLEEVKGIQVEGKTIAPHWGEN